MGIIIFIIILVIVIPILVAISKIVLIVTSEKKNQAKFDNKINNFLNECNEKKPFEDGE